jgi:hypothetical protein
MGDLMITPSNFVTQMGQDFDVDKLTNYQFNHIQNAEGKIEKLSKEYVDKQLATLNKKLDSAREKAEGLTNEEYAAIDNLFEAIFPGEVAKEKDKAVSNLIQAEAKVANITNKLNKKLAQNAFIEVHNKVYSSQLAEVQQKINKVLSMDTATNQAEAIDEKKIRRGTQVNLLSPTYQMDKLISGSIGAGAIAIYAKGVTFNSLAQQSEGFRLVEIIKGDAVEKTIQIGNIKSDGTFGRLKALSVESKDEETKNIVDYLTRSIAEALDEKVNTATDNEKAQILGRVGITHIKNVAVDNLLTLLGVDLEITPITEEEYNLNPSNKFYKTALVPGQKDPVYYTEYAIPYLLHSQPIIVEYFKRVKNGRAIIGTPTANLEKELFEEMMASIQTVAAPVETLTGENLANSLSGSIDTAQQKAVLQIYFKLMQDGDSLKELNQLVDMSNLGKSMWESKKKVEDFKDLIRGTSELSEKFIGIESLLGEYNIEGVGLDMGEGEYFEPKTNQGIMVGTALSLSRNLFYDHFPYYDADISKTINDIIEDTGRSTQIPEQQEFIFQEIKKFITSSEKNGIFQGSPDLVREDLFFEQEGSPSLSTYISERLSDNLKEEHEKGLEVLNSNVLLTSMVYEKGNNGKPDLIKFDNTAAGNISEEDYHIAFKELLVSNETLPDRNGQPYTTTMLGQDLIAYSHLSGGIVSQAIEFHKFIPIEYYDQVLVSVKTGSGKIVKAPITRVLQEYNPLISSWSTKERLEGFTTQFYQNNPSLALKVPKKDKNKLRFSDEGKTSFLYVDKKLREVPALFISLPNKDDNNPNKWELYKNVEGTFVYNQIETVGDFGMSEYSQGSLVAKTGIIHGVPAIEQQVIPAPIELTPFIINTGDSAQTLLERVKSNNSSSNPNLAIIAETLLDIFQDKIMPINVIVDSEMRNEGQYQSDTDTLVVRASAIDSAEVFTHEFIHAVTVNYLKPYMNVDGSVKDTAPKEVQDVHDLWQETSSKIIEANKIEYQVFKDKYDKWSDKSNPESKTITFSPRELSVFYATVNIREYLAISLANNQEFLEETSKMKYKGGLTLIKKFGKVMQRFFNLVAGQENTLAHQIIAMNLTLVEHSAKTSFQTKAEQSQEMNAVDAEWAAYQAVLNDPVIQITPPEIRGSGPADIEGRIFMPAMDITDLSSLKLTEGIIDDLTMPENIKPCN